MSKVAVITGASAGVGRATVRAFAKAGYEIGLIARGEDGLRGAAREVEEAGGRALVLPLDVADAEAVEAAAATVERELGPIDVWVNNAMLSVFSPVKEMKAEEYERVTQVTYLGFVYGTLAALRRMLPRDRGAIVQVGSALAHRSIPLQSAYCGAKHAIAGFTQSLRCELLHDGSKVKVSLVNLPAMNTPQFGWVKSRLPRKPQPVPPIYQPEIAADAILWAARHNPREMLVGEPTVAAVVGEKFIPGILDHYLGRSGYNSQQTDEPVSPDREDNLWKPVPGDHGPHGTFGARAHDFSGQVWLSTHRYKLLALGIGGGLLAAAGAAGLGYLGFKTARASLRMVPRGARNAARRVVRKAMAA
ncbi:MAG: SDR family oxidoreductase [Terriglobales bacterium]|jgi:short-subunit dehydrogenase